MDNKRYTTAIDAVNREIARLAELPQDQVIHLRPDTVITVAKLRASLERFRDEQVPGILADLGQEDPYWTWDKVHNEMLARIAEDIGPGKALADTAMVLNDGGEEFVVSPRAPREDFARVTRLDPELDCEVHVGRRVIRDRDIVFKVKRGPAKGRRYTRHFETATRLIDIALRGKHRNCDGKCPWTAGSRENHLFKLEDLK